MTANIQKSDIVLTESNTSGRSGAVVLCNGADIPREAMRVAQSTHGVPQRWHVDKTTAPALALRIALEKTIAYNKELMRPENLKGSGGVWVIMRRSRIQGDADGLDKGTRAGDLFAQTEIKAWIDKKEDPMSGRLGPQLVIEGATPEIEQSIRDNYDYLSTVVPSGKFGTEVGRYIREECGGIALKVTKPGQTGQGKGGTLYVPEGGMDAWERYCDALSESGCEAAIYHIEGRATGKTAEAVAAAINSEVEYELSKIEEEIVAASIGERALKGRQDHLDNMKSKLDKYADMLGNLADGMRARIADVDVALVDAIVLSASADDALDFVTESVGEVAHDCGDLFE